MDVRQPRAREARPQFIQSLRRDVERIDPPARAHERAQRERLATGAGAEIHHHLAASRREELAEHLAALVLDLDCAGDEERMRIDRRLLLQPDARRRVRGRARGNAVGGELSEHRAALRPNQVDAQIERRWLVERVCEARQAIFAEHRHQPRDDPVGEIPFHREGQRAAGARLYRVEPIRFLGADRIAEFPDVEAAHPAPPQRARAAGRRRPARPSRPPLARRAASGAAARKRSPR